MPIDRRDTHLPDHGPDGGWRRPPDRWGSRRCRAVISPSVRALVDQLEVQQALFSSAAASAARRATPDDLRRLGDAAGALAAVPATDLTGRSSAVFELYDALRDASRNDHVVAVLHTERRRVRRLLHTRHARADLAPWRAGYLSLYSGAGIVAAVTERDADSAHRAAAREVGAVRAAIIARARDR